MVNEEMQKLLDGVTGNLDKLGKLGKKLPNNKKQIGLPDEWFNGIKIDYTRQPIDKQVKPTDTKFVNEVVIETEQDMPEATVEVLNALLKILKDIGTKVRISPTDPAREIVEASGITANIYTPFAKFGSGIPAEDKETPPPAVFFERPSAPYFRVANWVYGNNRDGAPVLQGFKAHGKNMAATAAAMYYGVDLKSLPSMAITFSGSGVTSYDPQGFKLKEYNTGRLIRYASRMDIPIFNIAMSDSVANIKVHIGLMVRKFHHDKPKEGDVETKLEVKSEDKPVEVKPTTEDKPVEDKPVETDTKPDTPTTDIDSLSDEPY